MAETAEASSPLISGPKKADSWGKDCNGETNNIEGSDEESDEAQCCPICFESWANSGDHRLASLKCGHLFGLRCIEKWLSGKGGGKCPQCNEEAKSKDIRLIYAKALKVLDTSEKERALEELRKEKEARVKAELNASQNKMRLQEALAECDRLKALLKGSSSSMSQTQISTSHESHSHGEFNLHKVLTICNAGGCRVMAFSPATNQLCVSQPSSNPLFPGHGFRKICLASSRLIEFTSIHTGVIRDLSFCPSYNPQLLSCSNDNSIKITNIMSNAVVLSFQVPVAAWSCAWDSEDQNYFYAGLANGKVNIYDLRNTTDSVGAFNVGGAPVVSLKYVPHDTSSSSCCSGLLVGQLNKAAFFAKEQQEFQPKISLAGYKVISLDYEDKCGHFVVSCRPSAPQFPNVRHQVHRLTMANDDVSASLVHSLHGGSTQRFLSRSKIFSQPDNENHLLLAAGDEGSSSLLIWDLHSKNLAQRISCGSSPIMDIASVACNSDSLLVGLTDKSIHIHRWSV